MNTLIISYHAQEQMQRRSISKIAVAQVIDFGTRRHVHGSIFYVMRRKDIISATKKGVSLSDKLLNIHVICDQDDRVITVYKASNLKQIAHKQKISRDTIRKLHV